MGAHRALHGDHDVAALAHAAKLGLELAIENPDASLFLLRQPHPLERAQPADAQGLAVAFGHGRDHEHVLARVLQDAAVERREAFGPHLVRQLDAPLPFELLAQLARDQLARPVADAMADIVARHDEVLAAVVVPGDDDVAVRMPGIEVVDGDPVELGPKVPLHPGHQIAHEAFEVVHAGPVLGRDDQPELIGVAFLASRKSPPSTLSCSRS